METSKVPNPGTIPCSEDETWICMACGKKSRTKYGFDENNISCCDHGWDVSCAMNAELIKKEELKDLKMVSI
jgi:hypothetical protein